MRPMLFIAIPALLAACSFAEAQDAPDLHDDDPGLALQPQDEPQFAAELEAATYEPILFADAHSSCVQAQLDAEAMLADVRAAHDAEATLVLRDRERR